MPGIFVAHKLFNRRNVILLIVLFVEMFFLMRPVFADTQLLTSPWKLSSSGGSSQVYQSVPSNVLSGMSNLTLTYDLHGLCALKGDASAIIIDQSGWKYVALASYGQNCKNGQQTVTIPLANFKDISSGVLLDTTKPLTGSFHARFWNSTTFTVDIYSATLSSSVPNSSASPTSSPTAAPTATPNSKGPAHTVIVVEENHQLQQLLGTGYFTTLANQGALMVQSYGIAHPSQPNYLALFSGSTQGVTSNTCPPPGSPYSTNNLGTQLISSGFSFVGYAESQPVDPLANCLLSPFVAHHVPWLFFSNIPSSSKKTMNDFPTNFDNLPTVSFVIPNNDNNTHDGSIAQGAAWLQSKLDVYKQWAMNNNSLLIVTTDEDDDFGDNLVYTVFVGPMIKPGIYNETINHYNVLSTVEDLYGLPHLNSAPGITDIFK